jgi:Collagen triple helix repeat (20 copies)
MLSPLRNRFGIPGVISVIALVFAMLGGAYAASNDSSGSKASASAKAKRGPRGPKGPAGPAGPAGPGGPAGAKGDTGAAGANGNDGAPGAQGKEGPQGKEGKEGKAGKDGKDGKDGEPWTAGGTLPSGETEVGGWSFGRTPAEFSGEEFLTVALSFPIPLAAPIEATEACDKGEPSCPVHVILANGEEQVLNEALELKEVTPTECGSAIGPEVDVDDPQAKPGNLCVYVGGMSSGVFGTKVFGFFDGYKPIRALTSPFTAEAGASTAGAQLLISSIAKGGFGVGSFAVTAP